VMLATPFSAEVKNEWGYTSASPSMPSWSRRGKYTFTESVTHSTLLLSASSYKRSIRQLNLLKPSGNFTYRQV
jgi:hypothetical protein